MNGGICKSNIHPDLLFQLLINQDTEAFALLVDSEILPVKGKIPQMMRI